MQDLKTDLGSKFFLVNIPEMRVRAYVGSQPVIDMMAVIGKPYSKTPLMTRSVDFAIFNPTWHIPASYGRTKMMHKIKRDAGAQSRKGIRVLMKTTSGGYKSVDATSVDWDNASPNQFLFRQRPGKGNPLGHARLCINAGNGIFLHGTANQNIFKTHYRALSLGCIRMENSLAMVKFALDGTEDWPEEKVIKYYKDAKSGKLDGRSITVKMDKTIPVYVIYWTSFVDNDGFVNFRNDIYKYDRKGARVSKLKDIKL